jgi:signal peptidase I
MSDSSETQKKMQESQALLQKSLQDLKKVQQTEKMNRINHILQKLHGTPPEQAIEESLQKATYYQTKLDSVTPSFKEKLLAPYYKMARTACMVEAQYYEIYDFVRSSAIALLLALLLRSLVAQPFNIPSESMLPTLVVGDYIFVSKYSYGYSNYSFPFAPSLFSGRIWKTAPKRGDVAVFRVVDDGNKDYIKRIVGLPGDRIQYKQGRLWVNQQEIPHQMVGGYTGKPMDINAENAPIIQEQLGDKIYNTLDVYQDAPLDDTMEFIVPEKHYFVSGDNRDNSQDSRLMGGAVGFVPEERLLGRAEFIFFSLDRASFLEFWKWPSAIRFERIFKKIE